MSLRTLLHLYDMEPPRFMGTPNQFFVHNYIELEGAYKSHNGRRALYIAHNYHTISEVTMTNMLWDYDLEDKHKHLVFNLEEVMSNALKVCELFGENAWKLNYTGGGIQAFLKVNPIRGLYENINVHDFQERYKEKYNLRTLDLASAVPTKLARAILSEHFKLKTVDNQKKWVTNGRYCVPISINDLTSTPEDLYELAESRIYTHIQLGGVPFDFKEITSPIALNAGNTTSLQIDWWSLPEEKFLEIAKVIFDDEYVGLMNIPNPLSTLRVKAAIKVKQFGIDKESAVQFFSRFELIAGWIDRNETEIRRNIYYIWNRNYKMR